MKFATRGDATLDLFLTNMCDHFSTLECFPPFGLSDRCTVIAQPRKRVSNQHTRTSITIRDIRDSNKMYLGRYFSRINWSVVTSWPTCEEKLQVFSKVIEMGMSNMSETTINVYPKDAPWMSIKLKELIRMHQQAFHANKSGLICIDGSPMKTMQCTKLLGVTLNHTLTCNDHIEDHVKKSV